VNEQDDRWRLRSERSPIFDDDLIVRRWQWRADGWPFFGYGNGGRQPLTPHCAATT
jgi:hypothetical protein